MQQAEVGSAFDWGPQDWLAGAADGAWCGRPGAAWRPLGPSCGHANVARRRGDAVLVGGAGGLWLARRGADRWRQLHDETLTMVQDLAFTPGEPGVLAASAYGVHGARVGEHGAWRWHNHREAPTDPSARYTLALLGLDAEGDAWLAATEACLWRGGDGGRTWMATAVADVPVRALARGRDGLWAGTDDGSVWRSRDGAAWQRLADGPGTAVLALRELDDGSLLVGTPGGPRLRHGSGRWVDAGPHVTTVALAVDPLTPGVWALGATPGGLWWTVDGGRRWRHEAGLAAAVLSLEAP